MTRPTLAPITHPERMAMLRKIRGDIREALGDRYDTTLADVRVTVAKGAAADGISVLEWGDQSAMQAGAMDGFFAAALILSAALDVYEQPACGVEQ